jgi:hypothetical protein
MPVLYRQVVDGVEVRAEAPLEEPESRSRRGRDLYNWKLAAHQNEGWTMRFQGADRFDATKTDAHGRVKRRFFRWVN